MADLIFRRGAAFALVGLGWLASGYFYLRLSRLGGDSLSRPGPDGDLCAALFGSGCDEALLAPAAWQLGLPLAGWGLVYFAVLGLLLAAGGRWPTRGVLVLGAAGAGASLVLAGGNLSGRTPLCPLCLLIHAANLALLVFLWLSFRREEAISPEGEAGTAAAGGARSVRLVGALAAAALLLGAAAESYLARAAVEAAAGLDREALLADFDRAQVREIPEGPDDPVLGDPEAAVRLVVFSSFQCPACRTFAGFGTELVKRFEGEVAVAFKHYPLESECNPALDGDLQPRSCEAAIAAEAARLQFAFWPYHDGLFATDLSAGEELLANLAADNGLDLERWRADRDGLAAATRVWADAELGARLEIDGTPAVFLNGRRVRNWSLPALEILIRHQLGHSG